MTTSFRITTLLLMSTAALGAQQPPAPDSAAAPIPAVGDMAPDFSYRAIDGDGVAARATRLSDHRGETVVLWFFIKARTRG